MIKKETGITLIALVVTIIVLLLLAGISISTIAGNNGLLSQATKTVKKTDVASAREEAELLVNDYQMEYFKSPSKEKSVAEYIKEQNIAQNTENYYVTVSGSGEVDVYKSSTKELLVTKGDLNDEGRIIWDDEYEYENNPNNQNNSSTGYGIEKILYSSSNNEENGTTTLSFNFAISNLMPEEAFDSLDEQTILQYALENVYKDVTQQDVMQYMANADKETIDMLTELIQVDFMCTKFIAPLEKTDSLSYDELVELYKNILEYGGGNLTTEEAKAEIQGNIQGYRYLLSSVGDLKEEIDDERFARDFVTFAMINGFSSYNEDGEQILNNEFIEKFSNAKVKVKLPNSTEITSDAFLGFNYTIPNIQYDIPLRYKFVCTDWNNKQLSITIEKQGDIISKKEEQGALVRTETVDNLKLYIDYEKTYNGLDECYLKVKPSQYYKKPVTMSDLTQYLSEDEKWNIAFNIYTQIYDDLESVEQAKEAFSQQFGTDDVDTAFSYLDGYGFTAEDIMTPEYLENFDDNVNGVYKGITISIDDIDATKEWSSNFGCAEYIVTKNKTYTVTATYNGKVVATENITVNNILSWSNTYNSTTNYTDSEGNKAVIPQGFKIATTPGFNLVTQGLLVKDSNDNVYTWVPCHTLPEAEKTNATLNGIKDVESTEYQSMKSSVEKNGGFYVGRYETSLINGKAASKRSYTSQVIRGGTYQEQYTALTSLYNNSSDPVRSTMMWGGNYAVLFNLTDVRKDNNRSITASGFYPGNEQHHIYDLYDNLREISQAQMPGSSGEYDGSRHILYGTCSGPWLRDWPNTQITYVSDDLENESRCLGSRILLYINN